MEGVDEGVVTLANKTSNALERYNREFNGIVPTAHPNLIVFANALHKEAKQVVQRLEDVRVGREKPPVYKEVKFPEIPAEYLSFSYKATKAAEAEKKKLERKGRSRRK